MKYFLLLTILVVSSEVFGDEYHKKNPPKLSQDRSFNTEKESSKAYWMEQGQSILAELLSRKVNNNNAKNVILFLGDGMSISTVAAARTYIGGDGGELSFDKFPFTGLSKTFCVDAQVADSACTATAYLNGIKTNYELIGMNAKVKLGDCAKQSEDNWTESIARWAQKSCKATGIVTTTRITHASPAGTYAHSAHRYWENDFEMVEDGCDSSLLDDIAEQLVYGETSKNFKIMLGGGRGGFRNTTVTDEEGQPGFRLDGKDLIEEWKTERNKDGKATFIFDRNGLRNLDIENTDFVLGLFEPDHMKYYLDVKNQNLKYTEPSLSEMTVAAIKMLQKEENGYFLFVEGGLIDQGHHYNYARYAMEETSEFSKAIDVARQMTSESDTLIVVTADHSHVVTYSGAPDRDNPILGNADVGDADGLPYKTLSYANGPGYATTYHLNGSRVDINTLDFTNPRTQYSSTVPRTKDTHAGEDVGVWASGPMAHLFTGVYNQNSIPLLMAHVLQVGPYAVDERCASSSIAPFFVLLAIMLILLRLSK